MRFADLVAVLDSVAALDVRRERRDQLAEFLGRQSSADLGTLTTLLLRMPVDELDATEHAEVAPRPQPTLTCEQVAHSIAEIDRAAPVALHRSLVQRLLASATSDEQRWIDLAVQQRGLDRPTFEIVSSALAKAAGVPVRDVRRAATLSGSLPLSARIAFERGAPGLLAVNFTPGRPIPPTVAEVTDTANVLVDPPWPAVLEWNLRADVVQVHRARGEVRVYDRLLRDVTDLVPAIVGQVIAFPRGDLVLEGWADLGTAHSTESRVAASWTRMGRAGLAGGRALFYDVLYDGAPDVDEPLSVRRALLESIVPEQSRLPTIELDGLDSVATALNESMRSGHDGFVLKPAADPYEGGLVKSSWRLVPATHVVKLAVVAAEQGSGERAELASKVHLAARDEHGRLHEVGSTARGLTKEQIAWQTDLFASYAVDDVDEHDGGRTRLRPDIVAVVAADGVDESDRYDVGMMLRKPRILGYELETETTVDSVDALRRLIPSEHTVPDAPGLPRLPDAPVAVLATEPRQPSDAMSSAPPELARAQPFGARPETLGRVTRSIADVTFEPYHEPELAASSRPRRSVLVTRVLGLAWALAVLVASVMERSSSGPVDPGTVAAIGWLGLPIAASIVVAGWAWSDQLVRNLIKLDGRRPSRTRCVTAWLSPPVAAVALALVVVPLEPTQPADIRPAVIAGVFALAMWRPFALVRRILTTLTPLRSDTLIASAYLVDALCFGVMWWRLTRWHQRGDELTRGELDIMVGATAAVAVATAIGLVIWIVLVRVSARAEAQRRSSQRTRYEHRMLRLAGVNPSDPEVWWTLVQRRADEQRATAAAETEDETVTTASDDDRLPSVETLIEATRAEHSLAFRRLGAEASERLELRLREEFAAIVDRSFDQDDTSESLPPAVPAPIGTTRTEGTPTDHDDRHDPDDLDDLDDPIVALRRQTGRVAQPAPTLRDIETLIGRAGSVQVEAALAEHREQVAGREELVPPTLYGLEAARLAMVLAFGALAVLNGWIVSIALRSDFEPETGGLAASAVDELNLARDLFWAMFTTGAALVPIWAMVALWHARRVGIEGLRLRRVALLAALAATACAVGYVVEVNDRSELTLALSVVIVWAAVSAGLCVEPVRAWFELPSWTLTTWIGTLPPIVLVAWLAGLVSPLDATASLQRLAFTTILLAFGCARVAAVSMLSSVDLEDKFRSAPELLVPSRRRR